MLILILSAALFVPTQQTDPAASAPPTSPTPAAVKPAPVVRKHSRRSGTNSSSSQTTPSIQGTQPSGATVNQVAPPTAAQASQASQQRQQDEVLLEQQKADQQRDQQLNEHLVDRAQQRQQRIAAEPRVQDAPGPAQTGVVPGVQYQPTSPAPATPQTTVPAQPAQEEQRIQDAPGPAQTLPAQPTTVIPQTSNQQPPPQD